MKYLALLLLLVALPVWALSTKDAASHVGEVATVCGNVSEVHISRKATFIDMDGRYPDEEFTGLIWNDQSAAFSLDGLEGANICVHGRIADYRGRPEIILRSPSQLTREEQ